MNVDEYKTKLIKYFKSGKANKLEWEEMAEAVLEISECSGCPKIDKNILPIDDYNEFYCSKEKERK